MSGACRGIRLAKFSPAPCRRFFHAGNALREEDTAEEMQEEERIMDEVDVLIVGGGPAGLSAAIKIKQLAEAKGEDIRVVLLEKGAEIGNHILSGAVIQTNALDELIPDWKEKAAPLNQPALHDKMVFLTETDLSLCLILRR